MVIFVNILKKLCKIKVRMPFINNLTAFQLSPTIYGLKRDSESSEADHISEKDIFSV